MSVDSRSVEIQASSDTTTADGGLILIQAEAAAGDTLGGPMQMLMM